MRKYVAQNRQPRRRGRRADNVHGYYEAILADYSVNDVTHTLHYLLKILENMQRLDAERLTAEDGDEAKTMT